jgi:hypothetical protein
MYLLRLLAVQLLSEFHAVNVSVSFEKSSFTGRFVIGLIILCFVIFQCIKQNISKTKPSLVTLQNLVNQQRVFIEGQNFVDGRYLLSTRQQSNLSSKLSKPVCLANRAKK